MRQDCKKNVARYRTTCRERDISPLFGLFCIAIWGRQTICLAFGKGLHSDPWTFEANGEKRRRRRRRTNVCPLFTRGGHNSSPLPHFLHLSRPKKHGRDCRKRGTRGEHVVEHSRIGQIPIFAPLWGSKLTFLVAIPSHRFHSLP